MRCSLTGRVTGRNQKRCVRRQFAPQRLGELRVQTDIKNIAGATLSCEHVTEGRTLAGGAVAGGSAARSGFPISVRAPLCVSRPEEARRGPGRHAPLAPRNGARAAMSPALRAAILTLGALLWFPARLVVLPFAFAQETQFGPLPNPWEAVAIRAHGVLAVGAVFLRGDRRATRSSAGECAQSTSPGFAPRAVRRCWWASGYAHLHTGTLHEVASRTHESWEPPRCSGARALWRNRPDGVPVVVHWRFSVRPSYK